MKEHPRLEVSRATEKRTWSMLRLGDCDSASLFLDSGAFKIYNQQVQKRHDVMGEHGKILERKKVSFSQGDYSYYSLAPGSEFRAYCDGYAKFIKSIEREGTAFLFANVDAIANPDLSWRTQCYFEQEHGLYPVPVIHYGATLRHLDRYLENPKHGLIGMGGLGHNTPAHLYLRWADGIYRHICPKSDNYLPMVGTHGFAMTSFDLMSRYPWWSVDSATWVKLAAFGWILTPYWNEEKQSWRYDRAPMQINMSTKPTKKMAQFAWREHVKSPRKSKDRHLDNAKMEIRVTVMRWLEYLGVELGSFHDNGDVDEIGVCSNSNLRAMVNLYYLKDFEESRPKWPYPLDLDIAEGKRSVLTAIRPTLLPHL